MFDTKKKCPECGEKYYNLGAHMVVHRNPEDHKDEIYGQDHNLELIDLAIKQNLPALLIGETGTGKTTMIRKKARENNKRLTRFNLTGETTVDEFVGKFTLQDGDTVWQDGVLIQAMKRGHWLVVDEINVALPEILMVLHSLLDDEKAVVLTDKDGERVEAHEEFRFFATMNPVHEYAGTKELNKAFFSRFPMVIHIEYPSSKTEIKILKKKVGIGQSKAEKIASVGAELRKKKKNGNLYFTCSTRDLIYWAQLAKHIGLAKSFRLAIANKAQNEIEEVIDILQATLSGIKEAKSKAGVENLTLEQIENKIWELTEKKDEITREKNQLEYEREKMKSEIEEKMKDEFEEWEDELKKKERALERERENMEKKLVEKLLKD